MADETITTVLEFDIKTEPEEIDKLTSSVVKLNKTVKDNRKEINGLEKENRDLNKAVKDGKIAQEDANKTLSKNEDRIKTIQKQQLILRDRINETNRARREAIKTIKLQEQGLNTLSGQFRKAIGGLRDFSKGLFSLENIVKGAVIGTVISALNTLKNVIRGLINANIDFQESLQSLSAITGAVGSDLKFFEERAIELSKSVRASATEIVAAFELVGSKRPELLSTGDALVEVTKAAIILSEATGGKLGLEDAANSVTAALNQFSLQSSEATRVINALAAGSKFGAANITLVSQAIDVFGAVASNANVTFEESVGLIETLAEKNIVGAEAGTKLRNVILELQKDQENYKDGVFDLNLALDNLAEISDDSIQLLDTFGKQNVVAAAILAGNVERFQELSEAVTDTNTALEQQAIQNRTILGTWDRLINRITSYFLASENASGLVAVLEFIEQVVIGIERAFVVLGSTGAAVFLSLKLLWLETQKVIEEGLSLIGLASEETLTNTENSIKRTGAVLSNVLETGFDALTGTVKETGKEVVEILKETDEELLKEAQRTIDKASEQQDKANQAELDKIIAQNNAKALEKNKFNERLKEAEEDFKDFLIELAEETDEIQKESDEKFLEDQEKLLDEIADNEEKRVQITIDANEKLQREREKDTQRALSEGKKTVSNLFSIISAGNNRQEQEINKSFDRRQKRLEDNFNNGLITQEEFTKQSIALDRKRELELYEIELAKFKTDQIAAVSNIAIDTASAVTKSIAESPLTFGLPWSAFAAGQGILQAAAVLSQPAPPRPSFAKGGEVKSGVFGGNYHSSGGTTLSANGVPIAEVEKDERFFVMNRSASAAISNLSKINESIGGGRSFSEPAKYLQDGGVVDIATGLNSSNIEQIVASFLKNVNIVVSVQDIDNGLEERNDVLNVNVIN